MPREHPSSKLASPRPLPQNRTARPHLSGGPALLLALLLLGLWEALGLDLWLIRPFGSPAGFALREHPLFSQVLHNGGRLLAWAAIALLAWDAWALRWSGPSRRLRWGAIGLVLLATVLIAAFKRVSETSCPWDTLEFGGAWPYVPHWWLQLRDGGPGHCFPSGHASAAFAFLLAWAVWHPFNPLVARRMLLLVLVLGSLFAGVQMVRGAHYLSHSLWTAWLCWAMAWAVGRGLAHPYGLARVQRDQPKLGASGLATGKPAAAQAS